MTNFYIFLFILAIFVSSVVTIRKKDCEVVEDCEDDEGRTVCWSKYCFRDVPCNKDDDCYFYGALHMLINPRFRCYVVPAVTRPAGYGTCIEESYGEHLYQKFTDEETVPSVDATDRKRPHQNINKINRDGQGRRQSIYNGPP